MTRQFAWSFTEQTSARSRM